VRQSPWWHRGEDRKETMEVKVFVEGMVKEAMQVGE